MHDLHARDTATLTSMNTGRATWILAVVLSHGLAAQEDLTACVRDLPTKHDVPAVGCALIRDLELAGVGVAGVRKRGDDAKVTTDDLWHLGSCTKAMTATLIARLVERKKLKWDTPLTKAFPKINVHEDLEDVVLRDLLTHRSGLMANPMVGDLWQRLRAYDGKITTARTMIAEEVLPLRPAFEPLGKTQYSNTGYMIAGAIVERATKTSWEDAMRKHCFRPLGMKSAGFGPPGVGAKGIVQPWAHGADGSPIAPGRKADNPPALGPAGTVHATLQDWARFLIVHLQESAEGRNPAGQGVPAANGKPFLKAETLRALHEPAERTDYALGWSIGSRGWADGRVLVHNGSNTMWFCVCWLAPKKGMALLATCNQGGDAAAAACDAACVAMLNHVARSEAKADERRKQP